MKNTDSFITLAQKTIKSDDHRSYCKSVNIYLNKVVENGVTTFHTSFDGVRDYFDTEIEAREFFNSYPVEIKVAMAEYIKQVSSILNVTEKQVSNFFSVWGELYDIESTTPEIMSLMIQGIIEFY